MYVIRRLGIETNCLKTTNLVTDTRHATGRYRNHDIAVLSLFDFFDETVQLQYPSYVDGVVARAAAPFFVCEKATQIRQKRHFYFYGIKHLQLYFKWCIIPIKAREIISRKEKT